MRTVNNAFQRPSIPCKQPPQWAQSLQLSRDQRTTLRRIISTAVWGPELPSRPLRINHPTLPAIKTPPRDNKKWIAQAHYV